MILGGSGYLGKTFLQSFIDGKLKKYKVNKIILISRNIKNLKKQFKINSNNILLKRMDLMKTKSLPSADMIIHSAESSINSNNTENYRKISIQSKKISENLYKIFSVMKKPKKIIYMSSGAVYGYNPKKIKISENHKILLKNIKKLSKAKMFYALNKLNSEKLFLSLNNKKHNVMIVRGFTFMGIHLPLNQNYAIGNFLNEAIKKKPLIIKSKNSETVYRSYMSSDNLINSIMTMIIDKRNIKNPIFNIGSDHVITISKLAKKIANIFHVKISKPVKKKIIIDFYVPNIKKFKKYFNLDFKNTLDESIRQFIS